MMISFPEMVRSSIVLYTVHSLERSGRVKNKMKNRQQRLSPQVMLDDLLGLGIESTSQHDPYEDAYKMSRPSPNSMKNQRKSLGEGSVSMLKSCSHDETN